MRRDESTFCLQCWRVYSLQFRGRRAEHRKQQRDCRRDDRDGLSDLGLSRRLSSGVLELAGGRLAQHYLVIRQLDASMVHSGARLLQRANL
jgi:hypothetical protein